MSLSYHVSKKDEFFNNTNSDKRFYADPYIFDSNKTNCEVGIFTRENYKDYKYDLEYLRKKEYEYIQNIIVALNKTHKVKMSDQFWKKTLSISFRLFLFSTYDAYKMHHKNFNANRFNIKVLSEDNYFIPKNFKDSRLYFELDELGYEQMFSIYIQCFYPELYIKNKIEILNTEKITPNKPLSLIARLKNITVEKFLIKILIKINSFKKAQVIILEPYFSTNNLMKLLIQSMGKIKSYSLPLNNKYNYELKDTRKVFVENLEIHKKDKFDEFFYYSLLFNFPKELLESFDANMKYYASELEKIKTTKYIINESWIGSSKISFFLALAKEKYNIKHINNEHNYLSYFAQGTDIDLQVEVCDLFYTIGWENNKYKNMKKGASLFEFVSKRRNEKKDSILYVSGESKPRRSSLHTGNSMDQEHALDYIEFINIFFKGLDLDKKSKVIYRGGWPKEFASPLAYNRDNVLGIHYKDFYKMDDYKLSARQLMQESRLIVIDYIATLYLESFILNTPTVFFWNQNAYFLEEDFIGVFDDFIEVGICQTSPEAAAKFINKIYNNVEEWWYSKSVQNARKKFLDANIGNPEDAINFYLSLVQK